jgi:Flp pilus assembly protein TadG
VKKSMPRIRLRSQRGTTVVEFALVAVIFFTLFFAVMEFGFMFWSNLTMQHAVREGARYAVVGSPPKAGETRCSDVTDYISGKSLGQFERLGSKIGWDVVVPGQAVSYSSPVACPLQNSPDQTFGQAAQIVVISVYCTHKIIMPFIRPFFESTQFNYNFTVRATMRNEAFPTP